MTSKISSAYLRVLETLVPSCKSGLDRLWRCLNSTDTLCTAQSRTGVFLPVGAAQITSMKMEAQHIPAQMNGTGLQSMKMVMLRTKTLAKLTTNRTLSTLAVVFAMRDVTERRFSLRANSDINVTGIPGDSTWLLAGEHSAVLQMDIRKTARL